MRVAPDVTAVLSKHRCVSALANLWHGHQYFADLRYCHLDKHGKPTEITYDQTRDLAPGRILKIKDDDKFNQGTLVLCDQARKVEAYKTLPDLNNAKIFTFPLKN